MSRRGDAAGSAPAGDTSPGADSGPVSRETTGPGASRRFRRTRAEGASRTTNADDAALALPLRVESLCVDRGPLAVLEDVSFEVPAGGRLAVVGANGSGKSTLLRGIMGITRPRAGEISVGARSLSGGRLSARQRAQLLSFVSQEEAPAPELTVGEAVSLGRTPYRKPWAGHDPDEHDAVGQALDAVGMAELAGVACGQLSGGQRHRVVLARALAQRAPVMLLDEPTNHLDPVWRLRLMETLRRSGRTAVFSMHDLDIAMQYADLVAVLHRGTLAAFGPPAEVLRPPLVREVFGVASAIVARPGSPAHGAPQVTPPGGAPPTSPTRGAPLATPVRGAPARGATPTSPTPGAPPDSPPPAPTPAPAPGHLDTSPTSDPQHLLLWSADTESTDDDL